MGEAATLGPPMPNQSGATDRPWLTFLSWNVHALPFFGWMRRMPKVAELVRKRQPDIVALQEIWSGLDLDSGLFGPYRSAFAPRFGTAPRGGLAVLVAPASRWQVSEVHFETYHASAPWYRIHEGDGIGGKGILAVELRRDGERLLVLNTHLQAEYAQRRYAAVRRAQLEQLGSYVARAGDVAPILIAGDLNTASGEDLYRSHIATLGADLSEEERREHGGGTCFDGRGHKSEWIDYVLLRGLQVTASLIRIENERPDHPYSDHEGLLVSIERKGSHR